MKDESAVAGPKTKCLSTKLTDEEYATLEAAAAGQPLGTWARETLLRCARGRTSTGTSLEAIVVAEILALRAILLNLHFALATGDPITEGRMQQLIDRADATKLEAALARLSGRDQGADS